MYGTEEVGFGGGGQSSWAGGGGGGTVITGGEQGFSQASHIVHAICSLDTLLTVVEMVIRG